MAIYKTHKIIRKQTPIPLSTMPWVLYYMLVHINHIMIKNVTAFVVNSGVVHAGECLVFGCESLSF
jgi:hypothetical protein